jgi:predicted enzyme related to lactoylglutathione lyase
MKKGVNWFEIYTTDFERAKRFYAEVFQCVLMDMEVDSERHPEMKYASLSSRENTGIANGALVQIKAAQPGVGGTLVYFHSEDIVSELGRVEAAGGKIVRPKFQVGEFGFIALIEDTEGNMIGLHSSK